MAGEGGAESSWARCRREVAHVGRAAWSIVAIVWRINSWLGPVAVGLVTAGSALLGLLLHSLAWGIAALIGLFFLLAFIEIVRRERSAGAPSQNAGTVSYTHLRAHET